MKKHFWRFFVYLWVFSVFEVALADLVPPNPSPGNPFSTCHAHLDGLALTTNIDDEFAFKLIGRLQSIRKNYGSPLNLSELTDLLNTSTASVRQSLGDGGKVSLVYALSLWAFQMPGLVERRGSASLRYAERAMFLELKEIPHPTEWNEAPPAIGALVEHLLESARTFLENADDINFAVSQYKLEKTRLESFGVETQIYVARVLSKVYSRNILGEDSYSFFERSFELFYHFEQQMTKLSRLLPTLRNQIPGVEKETEVLNLLSGLQATLHELQIFYKSLPNAGMKLALLHSIREFEPRLQRYLSSIENLPALSEDFRGDLLETIHRIRSLSLIHRSQALTPGFTSLTKAEEELARLEALVTF